MADSIPPAVEVVEVEVTLLGDGAGAWIAELEIPSAGWHEHIEFDGYTDEDEAYNAAALMAIYRWRKSIGDPWHPITVTRVEPAKAEEV